MRSSEHLPWPLAVARTSPCPQRALEPCADAPVSRHVGRHACVAARWLAALVGAVLILAAPPRAAAEEPADDAAAGITPVAELERDAPVDFETEILPILRQSCLACHSATRAENDLVLETPATIREGGASGSAVDLDDPEFSMLLMMASGESEPLMPPAGNTVDAPRLTSEQLGLIRLWIAQGAEGEVTSRRREVAWQPLPAGVNPIYAAALSADGQFAACGRANQIFVYHLPTNRLLCRLTDPRLVDAAAGGRPGIAHRDLVQSLAFSPDGYTLASGGYRAIKLWSRPQNVSLETLAAGETAYEAMALSDDGRWLAVADEQRVIRIVDRSSGAIERDLGGLAAAVTSLAFFADASRLVAAARDGSVRVWDRASGHLLARIDAPAGVAEALVTPDGERLITAGADHHVDFWTLPAAPPATLASSGAPLSSLAHSADGRLLAMGTSDGRLQLVELSGTAAGRSRGDLAGAGQPVAALAFGTDGERVAAVDAQHIIRLWEVESGEQATAWQGPQAPVTQVLWHAASGHLFTASADGRLCRWRTDERSGPLWALPENAATEGPHALSRDGRYLASVANVAEQPAVVVRDLESGQIVATLSGHTAEISAIALASDTARVAASAVDGSVRIWNLADQSLVSTLVSPEPVTAVAFVATPDHLATGDAAGVLRLWNAATGSEVASRAVHEGPMFALAVTADGTLLVSAGADGVIAVAATSDLAEQRRMGSSASDTANTATTASTPRGHLAVSPDGRRVAVAGTGADAVIRLYDLSTGAAADGAASGDVEARRLEGHGGPISALAFSADGTRLASGGRDRELIVWDAASGARLERQWLGAFVDHVAFGPEADRVLVVTAGRRAAWQPLRLIESTPGEGQALVGLAHSAEGDTLYLAYADGRLIARDVNSPAGDVQFQAEHGAAMHALALSADGHWLATAGDDGQVRIWQAADGAPAPLAVLAAFDRPVQQVAFDARARHLLAAAADGEVRVLRVEDGQLVQRFIEHEGPVLGLFEPRSPQGSGDEPASGPAPVRVVSGSTDGTVRSWQLAHAGRFSGHTGPVTALALSPDATQLVSGGEDASLIVWNLASGEVVRKLEHGGPVSGVAWQSGGERLAAAGANALARIWNAADGEQIAELGGDFHVEQLVARLTERRDDTQARRNEAAAALEAAQKQLAERTEAATAAVDALPAAEQAATESAPAAKTRAEATVAADKVVADATAAQQAALEAKTKAEELAAKTQAALDAAVAAVEKGQTAAEALAAAADQAQQAADLAQAAVAAVPATDEAGAAEDESLAAAAKAALESAARARETATAAMAVVEQSQTALAGRQQAASEAGQQLADATTQLAAAEEAVAQATAAQAEAEKAANEAAENDKKLQAALVAAQKTLRDTAAARDRAQVLHGEATAEDAAIAGRLESLVERVAAAEQIAALHRQPMHRIAFSRDGRWLAIGSEDGATRVYDAVSGRPLESYTARAGAIRGVAFLPEGQLLAAAAGQVDVWELLPEWTLSTTLGPPPEAGVVVDSSSLVDRVLSLDFDPDGRLLASGGGEPSRSGEVKIWNVAEGTLALDLPEAHSDTVFCVRFSPDGAYLASAAADKFVRVFTVSDGQPLRSFEGHTHHVLGVAWQRDAKLLASSGADQVLKIWNFQSGEQQRTIAGFGKEVTAVVFAGREGETVAASGDATVRRHQTGDGKQIRTYGGGTDFMHTVAATPDGQMVAAGGQDSVLRIWNAGDNAVLFTFEPPADDSPGQGEGGSEQASR